jgi:spore germination protein YaaH
MNEENIREVQRDNGIPLFKYKTTVSATVYFDDAYSLSARMEMYKKMGVNSVGFWRLGQETKAFWPHIRLE